MPQVIVQTVLNTTGAVFRAALNGILGALFSNNAGSTAPTITVPGQSWFDEANNLLKVRNAANTGWITVGAGLSGAQFYEAITASGTWTKPAGYDANAMVEVEVWGGGGGGGRGSQGGAGGGGGSYKRFRFRYGDLASSVSVTIGAGGAGRPSSNGDGADGGTTIFATFYSAEGGKGGLRTDTTSPIAGALGGNSLAGAIWNGGNGGDGDDTLATAAPNTIYGGAGGGGGGTSGGRSGGFSLVGGGHGGAGTDQGTAAGNGLTPGGGGGGAEDTASGDGARGEVRIWIVG